MTALENLTKSRTKIDVSIECEDRRICQMDERIVEKEIPIMTFHGHPAGIKFVISDMKIAVGTGDKK